MITIKQLQEINLQQIDSEPLKTALQEILSDYNKASEKTVFIEHAQDNMNKIYDLVKKAAPGALNKKTAKVSTPNEVKKVRKKVVKKPKSNPKKVASKKSVSKQSSEQFHQELSELDKRIKMCRSTIRKYNEEKRKNQPPKPKPTRYNKIKGYLIALANLVPKSLKEDAEVQQQLKQILLKTHRGLIRTYQMNSAIKAQATENAIKNKFKKQES